MIQCGANVLNLGGFFQTSDCIFIGTGTSVTSSGSNNVLKNCKFINNSTTANRAAATLGGGANNTVINCEMVSYRGNAVLASTAGNLIQGCYIHDSNNGISTQGAGNVYINNLIVGNVAAGITNNTSSHNGVYLNNTLWGGDSIKVGTGINGNSSGNLLAMNNLFYGFVVGISSSAPDSFAFSSNYNSFFNNTDDYSGTVAGTNDVTIDPEFVNAVQITGFTATTSGNDLTQPGADFSTVIDNQDFCHIVSGTGVTAGQYLITAHTTTTLTLDIAPGTNATTDKVFRVLTGRNFYTGRDTADLGSPGLFPGVPTTSYMDIGATQRQEAGEYTDPGEENVRDGTGYIFNDAVLEGTLDLPAEADVKIDVIFDGGDQTGMYDGSDRWSDPGVSNVQEGVKYKANSLTNNRTGALIPPSDCPTVEAIAEAVCNTSHAVYTDPGNFGGFIKKLLTVAKFLGLK
jgi:hypothetical protein